MIEKITTILISDYSILIPNYSILGGTALHILFIIKKNRNIKRDINLVDLTILTIISIFLGFFAEALVIAYYEYKKLEAKNEVLMAFQWIAAFLGFSGVVWIIDQIKLKFDEIFKFFTGIGKAR